VNIPDILSELYPFLYYGVWVMVSVAVGGYLIWWLLALIAFFLVMVNADAFTIDPKNPGNEENRRRSLRAVMQTEVCQLAMGDGDGEAILPVTGRGGAALTLYGLTEEGVETSPLAQRYWDIVSVPEGDVEQQIPTEVFPWYDPHRFLFRQIEKRTGRYLVRSFFPGFVWGFWPVFGPRLKPFTHGRLDGNGVYTMTTSSTDHARIMGGSLYVVTNSAPTTSGPEIVLVIQVFYTIKNADAFFRWPDVGSAIAGVVNDTVGDWVRGGSIFATYVASSEEAMKYPEVTPRILEALTDPEKMSLRSVDEVKQSVGETLGLYFERVLKVDTLPATPEDALEINALMRTRALGYENARANAERAKQLAGASEETIAGLAQIITAEAAGKAKDPVYIVGGMQTDPLKTAALGSVTRRLRGGKTGGDAS
jgi:hypothetical protein